MNIKYAVIFERAENNWAAYVPDLPGCMTTGRTIEETRENMREAIRGIWRRCESLETRFLHRVALLKRSKSSRRLSLALFRTTLLESD